MRTRTSSSHAPYNYGSWFYDWWVPGGWWISEGSGSRILNLSTCTDEEANPGGNNILLIVHKRDRQEGITGVTRYNDGHEAKRASNYPNGWGFPDVQHPGISSPPGITLAARMSPAKPLVDLPLFLWELKDLKGMKDEVEGFARSLKTGVNLVRHAYLQKMAEAVSRPQYKPPKKGLDLRTVDYHGLLKDSAERLGGFNLSYAFGWAPLAGDIVKLTGFAEAFERRHQQLKRLYDPSNKGLRRRVTIGSFSETIVDPSTYLGSTFDQAFAFWGVVTNTLHSEKWATSRWKPQPWNTSPPPQDGLWDQWKTTSTLLGLNVSLDTLWNAIPFSWAADYFSNIGDFLEVTRNLNEYYCERVSVMQKTKGTRTLAIDKRSWDGTGGGGTWEVEILSRTPTTLLDFPTFDPFLGLSQVSNLASLSVAKQSAWRR